MSEDENGIMIIEKPEGRRKCPSCGENNKFMIHEEIDKKQIIMDYPRVYGKKFKCGKCGSYWKESASL